MRFTLEINCDNAAFEYPDTEAEISRILREVADKLDGGRSGGHCRDSNGNTCGSYDVIDEDEK